ncbi:hypothetical protein I9W82_002383 [Candida metapsilosis]|uniref:Uncharacterized protein n=1 Tax=Candida metapsilosis TaxID=273372 RepID=A0A8H8DCN7_9ASCO|nr:hypothetical protein I9W82_002383 [Candida metapsilosis]
MRGYGGGYGRSSYGGGYGSSYGSGYGSSYGSSSRYGGSSSYGGRSSNRYSGYYSAPTTQSSNKGYTKPQQSSGNYPSKSNQKPNNYGKANNQQYKQTQANKNYPQSQYNQGSSSNSKYNNGSKQNYSNSDSKYRYKNKTVKNQTINKNVNVNQQQQPRGMFGRFGGGFGRMMKWPLMFMMFDRWRRPRHEPMPPMQQPQPQHPPIINVYNPPHDQEQFHHQSGEQGGGGGGSQARDATRPVHERAITELEEQEETPVSRELSPNQARPASREMSLTPNQARPVSSNKSDSQLIDDSSAAANSTRVKITRTKSEPNRLLELSHTPTTEPASSNASSTQVAREENDSDIHELRGYHTNEVPSSQAKPRASSKDLSRGLSNQTIGLQSILRQSPTHEA